MASEETVAPNETVVLLHGLYLGSWAMRPLAWRLGKCGFSGRSFGYASVRRTIPEHAARLHEFLEEVDSPVVHFLGHSLGGLVIRFLFHQYPDQRPGRVLTLGTPHRGSRVADVLSRTPGLDPLVKQALAYGLDGGAPPWAGDRPLGIIAGDTPIGAGMLCPGLAKPHDGTVSVAETRLGGTTRHTVLHASHSSMLYSREVGEHACHFLQTGEFP